MIPGEHTVYICSTSVNELCKEWNLYNVKRNGTAKQREECFITSEGEIEKERNIIRRGKNK